MEGAEAGCCQAGRTVSDWLTVPMRRRRRGNNARPCLRAGRIAPIATHDRQGELFGWRSIMGLRSAMFEFIYGFRRERKLVIIQKLATMFHISDRFR